MQKAVRVKPNVYRARVYYTVDGKRKSKSFTAPTAKEADFLAANYEHSLKRSKRIENIMLSEAIDRYIDARYNILSPSTIRGYRAIQRNRIDEINAPLSKIDSVVLQRWVNDLAADYSRKYIANASGLVLAALKYCGVEGLAVVLPPKIKNEIAIPTEDEIERMIDLAKSDDLIVAIMLGAFCGLRRGEICGLSWSDVDFESSIIHVRQSVVLDEFSAELIKSPKSYEGTRDVPMPERVKLYLLKVQEKPKPCNIKLDTISKAVYYHCHNNGMPYSIHKLRHYYCSVLMSSNVPMMYIRSLMGHSSDKLIKDVYAHVMESKATQINDTVRNLFGGSSTDAK